MSKVEVETEVVEYPCPNCGTYNKPYMHTRRLAIEVDPSVWHRKRSRMSLDTPSDPRDDDWIEIDQSAPPIVWNRGISDQRKEEFLVSNGFRVIHLSDSELKSIDRIKEVIEGCL